MTENTKGPAMEDIISLAKRRGFIYPGSEIYGGQAGTWDYGPMGVALKNNIKSLWWRMFVDMRDDMFGMDAAIIMNPKAWEASGHVTGFSDPLTECSNCKIRLRADQVSELIVESPFSVEEFNKKWKEILVCPSCKKKGTLGEIRQFNMMFKTEIGANNDSSSIAYLRPETAGGMFVNFKNVMDSLHPKLPFGLGQIGKAFRNEIAPRDFIFRSREFEQMEVEYFVHPEHWEQAFDEWRQIMQAWIVAVGIDASKVVEHEIADDDRAFYSKRTIDFEFEYPFGLKELYGLAYRTDYDLSNHSRVSTKDLTYFDEETKERFLPHVIEPSLGLDRTVLAVLTSAYHEEGEGDDKRIVLKLPYRIAPIKAAVSPLLKNKPELVAKAREVYGNLKLSIPQIMWDDNGNIGKRYRRQDEIGTPWCITIDFDTLEDDTVTVRNRDTMQQERIAISDLLAKITS